MDRCGHRRARGLLDLIQAVRGFTDLRAAMDEARVFLALPCPQEPQERGAPLAPAPRHLPERARRLFRSAKPIAGTPAATYLASRGLIGISSAALRYHPSCYYKASDDAPTESWPALLAAITNIQGIILGVHRTWLDRSGAGKAPVPEPRNSPLTVMERFVSGLTVSSTVSSGGLLGL
jgi:hypothetical protein